MERELLLVFVYQRMQVITINTYVRWAKFILKQSVVLVHE